MRENQEPESLWVMDHMQVELPTCRIDEPVGQAGARAQERGYSVCPVVNQNGIVFGLIGKGDWDRDPTASAEQLMDSAPTTLRPSAPLEKAKQMLDQSNGGCSSHKFRRKTAGRLLRRERKKGARRQTAAAGFGCLVFIKVVMNLFPSRKRSPSVRYNAV